MAKRKKKVVQPAGVSMEEYGPVSADIFMGREVEDVRQTEEAEWTIVFVGNGLIHNYDPSLPMPGRQIVGAALTMQILGAHVSEFDRTPVTELRFGLEAVKLNPLQYAIYDPQLTRGQLVFCQRSDANMPKVPPYPAEREWNPEDE
jgi:hypothetical protein